MQIKKLHLVLALLLPIQFGLVTFLKSKSYLIENYYSTTIFPVISKTLRLLLGWIPFSFGDAFAFILIGFVLFNVYKLVKNGFKNILPFVIKITALLSVLYCCFYLFWGLNYFREPLAKKLNLTKSEYSTEQLLSTGQKIVDKLNKEHLSITKNDTIAINTPLNINQIFEIALKSYKDLAKIYPELEYKYPSIKKSLVSNMHTYTGTNGYFNPITNEAQINYKIPRYGMPATACHEMAHQIGWSAENDANFVSFLTCINSSNAYFKYAGYRMAIIYVVRELRKRNPELEKEFWGKVNPGVLKDFENCNLYWDKYKNPIEPIIKKSYGSYLKANNQASGIKSYNYVVDLIIAYDKQHSI